MALIADLFMYTFAFKSDDNYRNLHKTRSAKVHPSKDVSFSDSPKKATLLFFTSKTAAIPSRHESKRFGDLPVTRSEDCTISKRSKDLQSRQTDFRLAKTSYDGTTNDEVQSVAKETNEVPECHVTQDGRSLTELAEDALHSFSKELLDDWDSRMNSKMEEKTMSGYEKDDLESFTGFTDDQNKVHNGDDDLRQEENSISKPSEDKVHSFSQNKVLDSNAKSKKEGQTASRHGGDQVEGFIEDKRVMPDGHESLMQCEEITTVLKENRVVAAVDIKQEGNTYIGLQEKTRKQNRKGRQPNNTTSSGVIEKVPTANPQRKEFLNPDNALSYSSYTTTERDLKDVKCRKKEVKVSCRSKKKMLCFLTVLCCLDNAEAAVVRQDDATEFYNCINSVAKYFCITIATCCALLCLLAYICYRLYLKSLERSPLPLQRNDKGHKSSRFDEPNWKQMQYNTTIQDEDSNIKDAHSYIFRFIYNVIPFRTSHVYDHFINFLRLHIDPVVIEKATSIYDLLEELMNKALISVGDYNFLIKALQQMEMKLIANEVYRLQSEIQEKQNRIKKL